MPEMRPENFHPEVSAAIWERYPDYRALSVVVTNYKPESPLPQVDPEPPGWCDAHVEAWREVFRTFGANPKRTAPSLDSLLRRYRKDGALPAIHSLVDYYNALSLSSGAPFGGENIALYSGVPRLVVANGNEPFDTVRDGAPVIENPEPGEIIWRDDQGVTCRRWNWRQCRRTAITETSSDLWFVIDRLQPMSIEDLELAGDRLVSALTGSSPGSTASVTLLKP